MSRYGPLAYLAVTVAVVLLGLTGLLVPLRNALMETRFALVSRPPTGSLALVDIDAASIAAKGRWPWDRAIHAALIDSLRKAEAADIAFDVDFSAPSTPGGDEALQAALERADGTVILAALQQSGQARRTGALIASHPLDRFARHSWEGSVDVRPDDDGAVRRFFRNEEFGTTPMQSLASVLGPEPDPGSKDFLVDFGIDARQIDHISAIDLLNGSVDKARIAGKKVIVGATAVELRDFFNVPRFGSLPGALLQAVAAESLMQGRALRETHPLVPLAGAGILLIVLFGLRRITGFSAFLALCIAAMFAVEAAATAILAALPVIVDTAALHVECLAVAMVAIAIEIDDRRIAINVSRGNASRLRVILDRVVADNFAGIVVVDHDGIVRAMSGAAGAILAVAASGEDDVGFERILPPPLATAMAAALERARRGSWEPEPAREVECRIGSGAPAVLEYVITVSQVPGLVTANGRASPERFAACLTFQDVTERRRTQARLAHLAHFDSLTGLANRHTFLTHVDRRLQGLGAQHDACIAVLFFDLDRFKVVNDRLGHSRGDALLQAVADRVRRVVHADDIAARLGGDEFALLIERPSRAEALRFAGLLVHELGGLYEIGDYQSSIGVSIGMAAADGLDGTLLMRRADAALGEAKAAGGDRVRLFDTTMEQLAEAGKRLEQDLRDALFRGEFEVFYQRQVDLVSETIVGVEALARWRHPTLGFVSPAQFIPLAERTGLIEPLGAWVLRTACAEAASWPVPIKVSVNLSAVQLSRANLTATVVDALRDSGLPPERLDLELTESLLMENDGPARTMLDDLRRMKVRLSLDDFGTGYSSLSYLKSFAIDKIKIDQSFVRDLPADPSSIAIIRAVVSLAQSLGLRVNAEGVETVEQMRLLRQLGCDEVQGYLHGKAEPSAAIDASLAMQSERLGRAA